MQYLIMDFYGSECLYIEYDDGTCALYIKHEGKWKNGGTDLMDARVGFDESEPPGSPYRYGNGSCMHDIWPITEEEAEKIVGHKIEPLKIKEEINSR